jgi:hypothetical protein
MKGVQAYQRLFGFSGNKQYLAGNNIAIQRQMNALRCLQCEGEPSILPKAGSVYTVSFSSDSLARSNFFGKKQEVERVMAAI